MNYWGVLELFAICAAKQRESRPFLRSDEIRNLDEKIGNNAEIELRLRRRFVKRRATESRRQFS